jgi:hypothetical protein
MPSNYVQFAFDAVETARLISTYARMKTGYAAGSRPVQYIEQIERRLNARLIFLLHDAAIAQAPADELPLDMVPPVELTAEQWEALDVPIEEMAMFQPPPPPPTSAKVVKLHATKHPRRTRNVRKSAR